MADDAPAPAHAGHGPDAAAVREVLAVRPGGLAEVVRAVPALRHLRDTYPIARVSVVAAAPAKELLDACPFVDRTVLLERPSEALLERFDVAISFSHPEDQALAIDAVEAGTRIAWRATASQGDGPNRPVWPQRLDGASRMLRLAWLLGGALQADGSIGLWASLADRNGAASLVSGVQRPIALVHVGSSDARRRWPTDRWGRVIDAVDAAGLEPILVGTDADRAWVDEVEDAATHPARSLVGDTTVGQLVGLLERAALFVGSDSGPAALAGALGVRSVIVGPASAFEHQPRPGVIDLVGVPGAGPASDGALAAEVPLEVVLGRVDLAAATARRRWERSRLA